MIGCWLVAKLENDFRGYGPVFSGLRQCVSEAYRWFLFGSGCIGDEPREEDCTGWGRQILGEVKHDNGDVFVFFNWVLISLCFFSK